MLDRCYCEIQGVVQRRTRSFAITSEALQEKALRHVQW